jgi:hypothetical protein
MAIVGMYAGGACADALLIRGEIAIQDAAEIEFSVPVCLLEAIKTSGISAIVEDKDGLCERIDALIGDLASMKGEKLFVLEAEDEATIHIWVDEVGGDEAAEANFIMVDIDPAEENEPNISLRLPKGLFFLGAFIGNQLMETYGKEFLEMIRQQIIQSNFPPIHSQKPQAPCCEAQKECPAMAPVPPAHIHPKEMQKEIMKNVDPQKIRKEVLQTIMKEILKIQEN